MIRNNLKIAYRNLLKNKAFSVVNIIGLAVGICSFLSIALIVSFELSFENFWPNKERIYRITSKFDNKNEGINYNAGVSAPIPLLVKKELAGFEKTVPFQVTYSTVRLQKPNQKPVNLSGPVNYNNQQTIIYTQSEFFDIFPHKWLIGNAKQALGQPNQVVLSESKMKKYFGSISPEMALGQVLIYEDSLMAKVAGIVADLPANTDMKATEFISFSSIETPKYRGNFQLDALTNTNSSSQALVLVSENANINAMEKSLNKFVLSKVDKNDEWAKKRFFELQPLTEQHFNTNYSGALGRVVKMQTLYILLVVAAFLLLMACINFINLSTVQAMERGKEIAVKKVIGGSKKEIVLQFLTETFLITIVAFLLGLLLIQPIFSLFKEFIPTDFIFTLTAEIILICVAVVVVTAFLSGLYPAILASGLSPVSIFKGQYFGSRKGSVWLRKGLIVFQFVISQVFILSTIMVAKQSDFLLKKDMGFSNENLSFIDFNWQLEEKKKPLVKQRVEQLPEIESLSLSTVIARTGWSTNSLKFQGQEIETHQKSVDENFTSIFNLKFVAGRPLAKCDTVKELIVNEAFVRVSGYKSPHKIIGQLVDWWDTKGKPTKIPIVGVMKDFNFQSLHNQIKPLMLRIEPLYASNLIIKTKKPLNSAEYMALEKKISAIYQGVYPTNEEPIKLGFLNETLNRFYAEERKLAQLVNMATMLAILISCLGLIGLTAYGIQKRTKEIGIRKVLGASIASITALLSKDFLKLVLVAIVLASPIAYFFMNKWLADFAFRTQISWWIFALAGFMAVLIALLTIGYQSVKAALMNPVKSLKTE